MKTEEKREYILHKDFFKFMQDEEILLMGRVNQISFDPRFLIKIEFTVRTDDKFEDIKKFYKAYRAELIEAKEYMEKSMGGKFFMASIRAVDLHEPDCMLRANLIKMEAKFVKLI